MATITVNIRISKARVLDEAMKTTSYIGKKAASAEDPGTYERVAAIDANREPNQNKIIADGTYAECNTWRHRYNKEDDIYEYYLPLVKILNHKVNNKWDAVYVDPNDPLNA